MSNEKQNKMNVATEILNQLGGNKFLAMTGSHTLCADEKMLKMKLRKNAVRAQWLSITLNSMDTYDVCFYSVNKNWEKVVKKEFNGVYNDMLVNIFETTTGLYTKF